MYSTWVNFRSVDCRAFSKIGPGAHYGEPEMGYTAPYLLTPPLPTCRDHNVNIKNNHKSAHQYFSLFNGKKMNIQLLIIIKYSFRVIIKSSRIYNYLVLENKVNLQKSRLIYNYLNLLTRWWIKIRISSLASSFPGQEWAPVPNGRNVLGFGATYIHPPREKLNKTQPQKENKNHIIYVAFTFF